MTYIRQCSWCNRVWDPSKNEWVACDHIVTTATHTACEVCSREIKIEIHGKT